MANPTIQSVLAREVLDSRGNPTVEVEMTLSDGAWGRAIVPSGASTGEHEALELRDGDKSRYLGRGVLQAVQRINDELGPFLIKKQLSDLKIVDELLLAMDGTTQKSKLGGNTILGISLALAQVTAASRKQPLYEVINGWMGLAPKDLALPIPLMNILNGGLHANNGLEIQEFMIVPHGFSQFSESLRAGAEVFHHLKKILHDKHLSTAVGDEGGFAPALESNEHAIELICEAVKAAGYSLGKQISLALDVAASSFYNREKGAYEFNWGGRKWQTSAELQAFYEQLVAKYPLVSIEDGLDENDWSGWAELTRSLGTKTQLVGDDLFVTQAAKVKRGIEARTANAVLIKVNQVGSLTETFETMRLCRENRYRTVASHRSGETEDTFIAHLAVGSGCGQIKTGSASRSERIAKYNELLRIEERARANGREIPLAKLF